MYLTAVDEGMLLLEDKRLTAMEVKLVMRPFHK